MSPNRPPVDDGRRPTGSVTAWTCPECNRRFARRGQPHECAPAMTLADYFSSGPAHERPIFEAVMAAMEPIGPVHVEPVSVGIFLKRARSFAQLRPRDKWVNLSFGLRRRLDSPRIRTRQDAGGGRTHHVIRLVGPDDVDEEVRDWLAEAYALVPD